MPSKQPDYPVLVPYKDLVRLLETSGDLALLRLEVARLTEQQAALRSQFTELMEQFRLIKD